MKNIYDLLNQAEDNEDILSENERMEMTDKNAEFITEYCWIQKKSRKSNHVMSRRSIKIMRRRSK